MRKIVIVGSGHLARAVVSRWQQARALDIHVLARSNKYLSKGWSLDEQALVTFDTSVLRDADLVLLAVKPKDMPGTLNQLKDEIAPHAVVLSVAAGISIDQIRKIWPDHAIVRTMPNICAEIGRSVTGVSYYHITDHDKAWVNDLLTLLGYTQEMPEHLLNPMTALYGSGPAYVYIFIDAIMQAAHELGIPAEHSRSFAAYMVQGACEMALTDHDKTLGQLVDEVVSPGGTTEAMLKVLRNAGWQDILSQALQAAGERAIQLGQNVDPVKAPS
ncbi:MAG: pyrroline-5-carboxylate reductase [Sulfobacillus thermosulfidooxidans]|uniref:pyrroline-5-carboxylate reductase n=1 Tax=Sulfobacillus TaxID=28033 RepID=UPI000CD25206|nr:pyrroline-5-carboxylate reductase [Sulfobacillus sp. hq2]POB09651.1 pyrroline-5-carboxylate reductase [Sulfobacillus sp. hq2]PSR36553.1 MAG: pyrroline-5-carboxylate reductase [Sulfobacillus thermosulfidooxidans]